MGRKPSRELGNEMFWTKQITLKGLTLKMFNYDRDDREIGDSQLGSEIIREYYRRNPPLGFYDEPKEKKR